MRSQFYFFTKEEYKEVLEKSNSIKDAIKNLGMNDVGSNRKTFFRVIKKYGLDKELEELREKSEQTRIKKLRRIAEERFIKFEEAFIENSKTSRSVIKKYILRHNLIEYKCAICGNTGEWNGKDLSLHLDHINGVHNDHRIENLRFLCPNCHAQTNTYAGRNLTDVEKKKKKALKKIEKERKKREEKEKLIQERREFLESVDRTKFGWIRKVQDEWGVSHTQVKRWIRNNLPELDFFERKSPK